jgi:hypothetical protein
MFVDFGSSGQACRQELVADLQYGRVFERCACRP